MMAQSGWFIGLSFLLGGAVGVFGSGFLLGETSRSKRPLRSLESAASVDGEASSAAVDIDYDRLARACLAAQAAPGRSGESTNRALALSDAERQEAQSALNQVEEAALTHGVWSRIIAFKAQSLLRKLPETEAVALGERLDTYLKRGALKLQSGAWLPTTQVDGD